MDAAVSWLSFLGPGQLRGLSVLMLLVGLCSWGPVVLALTRGATARLSRLAASLGGLYVLAGVAGLLLLLFSPASSSAGYLGFFELEVLGLFFLGVGACLLLYGMRSVLPLALAWLVFCLWMAWSFGGGRLIDLAHPVRGLGHVEGYVLYDGRPELMLRESDALRKPSSALLALLREQGLEDTPPNTAFARPLSAEVIFAPESEFIYLAQETQPTPVARTFISGQVGAAVGLLLSSLLCGLLALLTPALHRSTFSKELTP